MEKEKLFHWANVLHRARLEGKPIPQLSKDLVITRADAYTMQEMQMATRLQTEKLIGWKMGLTSEAKRIQMNLDSPLYGYLTAEMQIANSETFHLKGSIHPKIEPEIAFLISKDLKNLKPTRDEVLEACEGVTSALEILDSRYENFKYFSMEDVIADNSSSSHFVIGPWIKDFKNLDLVHLKMKMSINDELKQEGLSKDISGDPVQSIIQLCDLLHQRGQYLKAGSLVLAGAATLAEPLTANSIVQLTVDHLPALTIKIEN